VEVRILSSRLKGNQEWLPFFIGKNGWFISKYLHVWGPRLWRGSSNLVIPTKRQSGMVAFFYWEKWLVYFKIPTRLGATLLAWKFESCRPD